MPASCCKPDYDAAFNARTARRELAAYRASGARGSALRQIDAIREAGVRGSSILDIGGGVGVIGLEQTVPYAARDSRGADQAAT